MQHKRHFLLVLISTLLLSILLACTWLPITSQAPVALAHSFVIGSDPVDGSTVSSAPTVVRIFFDEDIGPSSVAHVFAPDESRVDIHSSILSSNPRELGTPLMTPSTLPLGSYTVRWTALSSVDGHTTHGVIGFNIGQSSTGLPGQTILGPSTSNILPQLDLFGILTVAWDWLVSLALTFWIGILVIEGLIDSSLPAQARKQSLPLQWFCLAALLVGEVITLILRTTTLTQTLGGNGINLLVLGQMLVGTSYGHLWLLREALVGVALGLLWWTTRQQENRGTALQRKRARSRFSRLRQEITGAQKLDIPAQEDATEEAGNPAIPVLPYWFRLIWLVLAGLILLTLALSGDTAQLVQPHVSAIVFDWLFLAAQCTWLGGLAYGGYVLLPLLPGVAADQHAEMLAQLLRRLMPAILVTLGVLLVSGLFLTESSLSSAQQLFTDAYGRALLVKIILTLLMVILSGYTLFILRPSLAHQALLLPVVDAELPARRTRQSVLQQTERRLKQTLNFQSWLGAGVLFCAALMAFYAPPIVFPAIYYTLSISSIPVPPNTHTQTQQVGGLAVTLQVLPGRIDYANTVVVTINDSNGNPVTDAQVQLRTNMEVMDMGTAQATVQGGNPTYIATFGKDEAFSMFGVWDITVYIQRPKQAPVQVVFKVTLTE